ncbi:MAG: type II toxin-antitoxin system VapC family toxin [Bacteroidetes bacterium]|nr:MAG: type II toxin-antitoxin system VapC family toxin [Bacteroidota bacterium]
MDYLLDTNICIFYLKGRFSLDKKIQSVGISNCYVSEITIAELKFGAENSSDPLKHHQIINEFNNVFTILPLLPSLDVYAKEKTRLRKAGTPLDEFDLLIGATAISNNLILVTNNIKHFKRMQGVKLEDWTSPSHRS